MKEVIEKARIAAAGVSIVGGIFKVLHWNGGNILLILGLSSLAIVHAVIGMDSRGKSKKEVYVNYLRNFSSALIALGALFKLMHWNGANIMLIQGLIGIVVSYALDFLWKD